MDGEYQMIFQDFEDKLDTNYKTKGLSPLQLHNRTRQVIDVEFRAALKATYLGFDILGQAEEKIWTWTSQNNSLMEIEAEYADCVRTFSEAFAEVRL